VREKSGTGSLECIEDGTEGKSCFVAFCNLILRIACSKGRMFELEVKPKTRR